jgi:hypothetical protein
MESAAVQKVAQVILLLEEGLVNPIRCAIFNGDASL